MGAVNSCCIPRRSEFQANHASTPKEKGHRRNISAAFNLSLLAEDTESTTNLLNINTATEEELMTLPGINRVTAQNIVDYRRRISGFKKVEDLALVSGVGATKLVQIRPEITVSNKKNGSSHGSSPDSSNQDLAAYRSNGQPRLVNVNTANAFQMTKIRGIGLAIAENIMEYREKKGLFKTVDELIKVKGIGPALLGSVRHQIILVDMGGETSSTSSGVSRGGHVTSTSYANGGISNKSNFTELTTGAGDTCSNRTSSHKLDNIIMGKLNFSLTESQNDLLSDILGPFASKPTRPEVEMYTFKHKNRHAIRIGSWNLQQCSIDKADNPGVRDVVCMTILENGLSVVAFQELGDRKALLRICDELNHPVLPNVKRWKGQRGSWECVTSEAVGRMFRSMEYNGFLYDKSQKISLKSSALLEKHQDGMKDFTRKPFLGVFKLRRMDCVLVSVHLKASGLEDEDRARLGEEVDKVSAIVGAVEQHFSGEHDVMILGDFNLGPGAPEFGVLKERGFINCIAADTFTNLSTANPEGSKSYDNIWIGKQTEKVYTGNSDVIRQGLQNPWIPNGWKWGGVVSDHCPVWAELKTGKDLDNGNITMSKDEAVIFYSAGS